MNETRSYALVFFGATGDLAYKKIFPSLHAMAKRGHLNTPVIGVAKSRWGIEQLRTRDSLEKQQAVSGCGTGINPPCRITSQRYSSLGHVFC